MMNCHINTCLWTSTAVEGVFLYLHHQIYTTTQSSFWSYSCIWQKKVCIFVMCNTVFGWIVTWLQQMTTPISSHHHLRDMTSHYHIKDDMYLWSLCWTLDLQNVFQNWTKVYLTIYNHHLPVQPASSSDNRPGSLGFFKFSFYRCHM